MIHARVDVTVSSNLQQHRKFVTGRRAAVKAASHRSQVRGGSARGRRSVTHGDDSYLDELDGQGALPHSSSPHDHQLESFLLSAHFQLDGPELPDHGSSRPR